MHTNDRVRNIAVFLLTVSHNAAFPPESWLKCNLNCSCLRVSLSIILNWDRSSLSRWCLTPEHWSPHFYFIAEKFFTFLSWSCLLWKDEEQVTWVTTSKRDELVSNWPDQLSFFLIRQKPLPAPVTIYFSGPKMRHDRIRSIAVLAILLPNIK